MPIDEGSNISNNNRTTEYNIKETEGHYINLFCLRSFKKLKVLHFKKKKKKKKLPYQNLEIFVQATFAWTTSQIAWESAHISNDLKTSMDTEKSNRPKGWVTLTFTLTRDIGRANVYGLHHWAKSTNKIDL